MEWNGLKFAEGTLYWIGVVIVTGIALLAGFVPGALFSNMYWLHGGALCLVSILAWTAITSTNLLAKDAEALKAEKTFDDAKEQVEVQEKEEDKIVLNQGSVEAQGEVVKNEGI